VSIVGLILAAGQSRRFGGAKLLVPLGGEPVVRWTARAAIDAGLEAAVVVAGPPADAFREALSGLPVRFIENPEAAEGMASSIRAGVAAMPDTVGAVVIVPADQPTTRPALIRELCRIHGKTGAPVVAPVFRGVQGPPVLFARELLPELSRLRGDRGARPVLDAHASEAVYLPLDEPLPPDVDTPADREAVEDLLKPRF
jgi:molybdenum cofactor cytidylyltransferase